MVDVMSAGDLLGATGIGTFERFCPKFWKNDQVRSWLMSAQEPELERLENNPQVFGFKFNISTTHMNGFDMVLPVRICGDYLIGYFISNQAKHAVADIITSRYNLGLSTTVKVRRFAAYIASKHVCPIIEFMWMADNSLVGHCRVLSSGGWQFTKDMGSVCSSAEWVFYGKRPTPSHEDDPPSNGLVALGYMPSPPERSDCSATSEGPCECAVPCYSAGVDWQSVAPSDPGTMNRALVSQRVPPAFSWFQNFLTSHRSSFQIFASYSYTEPRLIPNLGLRKMKCTYTLPDKMPASYDIVHQSDIFTESTRLYERSKTRIVPRGVPLPSDNLLPASENSFEWDDTQRSALGLSNSHGQLAILPRSPQTSPLDEIPDPFSSPELGVVTSRFGDDALQFGAQEVTEPFLSVPPEADASLTNLPDTPLEDAPQSIAGTNSGSSAHADVPSREESPKQFTCVPCRRSFGKQAGLARHIKSSHKEHNAAVLCSLCTPTRQFNSLAEIERHVQSDHRSVISGQSAQNSRRQQKNQNSLPVESGISKSTSRRSRQAPVFGEQSAARTMSGNSSARQYDQPPASDSPVFKCTLCALPFSQQGTNFFCAGTYCATVNYGDIMAQFLA